MREQDGQLFPVSYASKKLFERKRSYATVEKECLAVIWAVKKFMVYLYGKEFILQTDHQPLMYLNKSKFTNNRIMRGQCFSKTTSSRFKSLKEQIMLELIT